MWVPSGVIHASQKNDYGIQNSSNKNDETIEAKVLVFDFYHPLLEKIKDIILYILNYSFKYKHIPRN